MKIVVYTDGSCKKNGQSGAVGGFAYAIIENDEVQYSLGVAELDTTNQRMEMKAVISAVNHIVNNYPVKLHKLDSWDDIEIYTDSAYIYNCATQHWYDNWEHNGWINSKREPVANKDLWEQLIPIMRSRIITFHLVKGHTGDKWNEYVDGLAQKAAEDV